MKRIIFILTWCILLPAFAFSQSLSFDGISQVKPLKRGKTYQLSWSGGGKYAPVDIHLIREGQRVSSWEGMYNDGGVRITLPKRLKPSDAYYFKISHADTGEATVTETFQVKRRIPRLLKAIGLACVPAAILIMSQQSPGPTQQFGPPSPPVIPNN